MYQNKPEQAILTYQQGLEVISENPALAQSLARLYRQTGAIDEAIAIYQQLYDKQPANDTTANNLAMIIADYRQGTESLNQAFKIAQRFQNSENPVFGYAWLAGLLAE